MIQVRDVRPELHAELVRRAKLRGLTLTDFVESILEREVAQPDPDDWLARVRTRDPLPGFADEAIRAIRLARDATGGS